MTILINNLSRYSDRELISIVDGMKMGVVSYSFDNLKQIQTEIINRRLDASYAAIIGELMRQTMNLPPENNPGQRPHVQQPMSGWQSYPTQGNEPVQSFAGGQQEFPKAPGHQPPAVRQTTGYINAPQPVYSPKNAREESDYYDPAVRLRGGMAREEDYDSGRADYQYPMLSFCVPFYKIMGWIIALAMIVGFIFYAALFMINNVYFVFQILGGVVVVAAIVLVGCYFQAERTRLLLDIMKEIKKSK